MAPFPLTCATTSLPRVIASSSKKRSSLQRLTRVLLSCNTPPNFLYSTLSGQRPLTLSLSRGVAHIF